MTNNQLALMDQNDPLAKKVAAFQLPVDLVYLDGNSLGCLPLAAKQRAREVVEQQWGQDLIKSWNLHQWIDLPVSAGEKIGGLIGAAQVRLFAVIRFLSICSNCSVRP